MPSNRIPNDHLRRLLAQSGWTAHSLAQAVNTLGAQSGVRLTYDRTSVAHWLAGSRPPAPVPDLVSRALSKRLRRPVGTHETGLDPGSAHWRQPAHPGGTRGSAEARLNELCRMDLDPLRRAALLSLPYRPSTVAVRLRTEASTADPSRARPLRGPAGPTTCTLDGMTTVFESLSEHHGGGHARTSLITYLADTALPQLVRAPGERSRRRLFGAVARLSHVLAASSLDIGAHGLTQQYHQLTIALAAEADDPSIRPQALYSMSVHAHLLGHLGHAMALSDAALDAAGAAVPTQLRALVLTQQAHVQAALGKRHKAASGLAAAERHSRGAGSRTYHHGTLEYRRAACLLALGNHRAAVSVLDGSLRSGSDGPARTRTLSHALLATAHLRAGRPEPAWRHSNAFLDQAGHFDSYLVRAALDRLRGEYRGAEVPAELATRLARHAVSVPAGTK